MISTTYSDSQGFYQFVDLESGAYYIKLVDFSGYRPTVPSYRYTDRNSDVDLAFRRTSLFELTGGQSKDENYPGGRYG